MSRASNTNRRVVTALLITTLVAVVAATWMWTHPRSSGASPVLISPSQAVKPLQKASPSVPIATINPPTAAFVQMCSELVHLAYLPFTKGRDRPGEARLLRLADTAAADVNYQADAELMHQWVGQGAEGGMNPITVPTQDHCSRVAEPSATSTPTTGPGSVDSSPFPQYTGPTTPLPDHGQPSAANTIEPTTTPDGSESAIRQGVKACMAGQLPPGVDTQSGQDFCAAVLAVNGQLSQTP
jgi:hypothetical protein